MHLWHRCRHKVMVMLASLASAHFCLNLLLLLYALCTGFIFCLMTSLQPLHRCFSQPAQPAACFNKSSVSCFIICTFVFIVLSSCIRSIGRMRPALLVLSTPRPSWSPPFLCYDYIHLLFDLRITLFNELPPACNDCCDAKQMRKY